MTGCSKAMMVSSCAVRGPQGLSAYELAVRAGYSGTVEQWLASLRGQIRAVQGLVRVFLRVDVRGGQAQPCAALNGAGLALGTRLTLGSRFPLRTCEALRADCIFFPSVG